MCPLDEWGAHDQSKAKLAETKLCEATHALAVIAVICPRRSGSLARSLLLARLKATAAAVAVQVSVEFKCTCQEGRTGQRAARKGGRAPFLLLTFRDWHTQTYTCCLFGSPSALFVCCKCSRAVIMQYQSARSHAHHWRVVRESKSKSKSKGKRKRPASSGSSAHRVCASSVLSLSQLANSKQQYQRQHCLPVACITTLFANQESTDLADCTTQDLVLACKLNEFTLH